MTPEEKTKYQEHVQSVIELLQLFHDNLDSAVCQPDVMCSHCGQVFETKALVIAHVSVCEKNPLVQEIERLKKLMKAAFREAGELAFKDDMFDEDNYCWDHSKARKALDKP